MVTKQCRKCGEIKDLAAFHRMSNGLGWRGYRAQCRSCYSAQRRARHQIVRSRVAAQQRQYRIANGDRIRARDNAYKLANRERIGARRRAHYAKNRERIQAKMRAWQDANIEKLRPGRLREFKKRRARLRGVPAITITPAMITVMYEMQNGLCYYGREELNGSYTLDHKIPISRGGPHMPENIVLACSRCNKRKHTKTDIEFLAFLAGG